MDDWLDKILWIDTTESGFVEVLFTNFSASWSFYFHADVSKEIQIPSLRS